MKLMLLTTNSKVKVFFVVIIMIILLSMVISKISNTAIVTSVSEDKLHTDLMQMYKKRDGASLINNTDVIKEMFNTNKKIGIWAYEHEKKRTEYLKNWSILRNTKFISIESDIKIQRIRPKGDNIWVDFIHSSKLGYVYNDIPDKPTYFGIGTRRTIELEPKEDSWVIVREWYLDPFEDELQIPDELQNTIDIIPPSSQESTSSFKNDDSIDVIAKTKGYNRELAVEYADNYSGATFGSQNNYKYNKRYRDYTYLGGDCANFGSQILTNAGLKMDKSWFYDFKYQKMGGGTIYWIKAAKLREYLLYSGKARLLTKGSLNKVMEKTPKFPNGAYALLKKGDIICYDHKKSSHISIVTEFDPKGLPLVNSHSTDRYRVPWDMGWTGKDINYWLVQIRD